MKYVVEGVGFDSKTEAVAHARSVSDSESRPVRVEWGDPTYGETPQHEWVNLPETPVDSEPVDRTERLAKRFEPVDGAPPVSSQEEE